MKRPRPKVGSLPLISKPPKVEEPFRITDPIEVKARWEAAKAYYGDRLPTWAKELPTEWPPRYNPSEHAPQPIVTSYAEGDELPPWKRDIMPVPSNDEQRRPANFKKLKAARKKVEQLAEVVRNDAFDDWLRRAVLTAKRPDEWTRARDLYEGYLRHAAKYGNNRNDKRLATEVLATETAWGKMMGSLFPNKKRRRDGLYYPVRLKRGA